MCTKKGYTTFNKVRDHESAGIGAFLFRAAAQAAGELGLVFDTTRGDHKSVIKLEPVQQKVHMEAAEITSLLQQHRDKPLHEVFVNYIGDLGLSKRLTFAFPRSSGVNSETEGFIVACKDGVFNSSVYRSRLTDHSVKMVLLIIGVLGGIMPSLFLNLNIIPAFRTEAEILVEQMRKAVILGSLRLLRAHDSRPQ